MNGQSFRNITLARALTLMKESTHLSLTIKSNLMGFKEILVKEDEENVSDFDRSRFSDSGTSDFTNTLGISDAQISSDYTDSSNNVARSEMSRKVNALSNKNSNFLSQNNDKRQPIYDTKQKNNLGVEINNFSGYGSASLSKNNNTTTQYNGKTSMFEKLFTLLKGSSIASHEHNNNNTGGYDSTDEVSLFFIS